MILVLDSGGLTALATDAALARTLFRRLDLVPQVPTVVLTEALTGSVRRDVAVNRFLRTCQVRSVQEPLARQAAQLRTATGRAGTVSAVDAIVAASAGEAGYVLTSDPDDLSALCRDRPGVRILGV